MENQKESEVIESFLLNFESDSTRRSYRCHIKNYFNTIGVDEPETYFNNGRNYEVDVKKFAQSLQAKPPLSQKTMIACIRTFLSENNVDLKNKTWRNINHRIKGRRPVTDNVRPTNTQLKQILQHSDIKSKALFLTISSSGMRIGETLKLTLDDIDIENRTITIPGKHTKTGEKCITFFTKEAKDALLEWLKIRKTFLKRSLYKSKYVRKMFEKQGIIINRNKGEDKWHITKDGKPITNRALIKEDKRIFPFSEVNATGMWNLLLEKSGCNEKETDKRLKYPRYKFHIHTLRKYFISNMENVGVPESYINKYVNHVERYNGAYTPVTIQELRKKYDEHCNCLTVFSETYKVHKEIKSKIIEQDTAISSLTCKNKEYEDLIQHLKKQNERLESVSNHQFDRIRMLEYRIEDMSYQRALIQDQDAMGEREEKEYLKKFPTAKERKKDWDKIYNSMKTGKDMTEEEKSRYWFLNDRIYQRLKNKEGTEKHWIDGLITSS